MGWAGWSILRARPVGPKPHLGLGPAPVPLSVSAGVGGRVGLVRGSAFLAKERGDGRNMGGSSWFKMEM